MANLIHEPAEAGAAPRGYEFTERENVVIRKTGHRSHFWGFLMLAWGVVMFAMGVAALLFADRAGPGGVLVGAIYGLSAVIPVLVGLNFMKAGRSLKGVVDTAGMDIPHLMRGLEALGAALLVQIVTALAGIVLFGAGIVAALTLPLFAG